MQKKRGNGEGSIFKRKDGIWTAIITIGRNEDGKQKRKYYYGRTRQEVADKLSKIVSELKTGPYIESSKSTLAEWLDFWHKEYISNKVKLSTKISYETYITKHINPKLGHILLKDLRADMIQKYYNDKLKNGRLDEKGGLSPKTIKNMHNMLHEALDQAYKNDMIIKNACKVVTLPKYTRKEMRVLSPEEQKRLLAAAKTERLGIGVTLVLFTGLRLGELLGLNWKDIDLSKGILTVRQTLNRLKNYEASDDAKTVVLVGDTKTLNSKRQIPLHQIMINDLKKYKSLQKQEITKAGEIYNNSGFVFTNEIGKPVEPRTYQDFFYRLIKKAEIGKSNFHCLRHSFATRALEKGISAKTVSEILGHANISTTLDLYCHVSLDLKRESIEKLADFFVE